MKKQAEKCPIPEAFRAAAEGMRLYAAGLSGDKKVVSGESGAATLGAAALILTRPELMEVRKAMGFDENSVLLLISTEGDTDPENYEAVVKENRCALPE